MKRDGITLSHVVDASARVPTTGGEYVIGVTPFPPRYLKVHAPEPYVLPVVSTVERDGRLHLTLGERMDEVPTGERPLSLFYGALDAV
jgi:hypothetical protein